MANISQCSTLAKNLQAGYVILADRGFDIKESSIFYHAEFRIAAFTKRKTSVRRNRC